MTKLALHRCFLLVAVPALASAAESISGPVAGYVVDSSPAQLRAILGVPGAFGFSDPLSLPAGITRVRLAPGQDFALVECGTGAPGILFLKDGAVDRLAPIDGALTSADWVAFSPSAGSAILFSASANRLQVLSGLPDAPRVTIDLDAAMLPEQPRLGAVSDDGSLLLVASEVAVYRVPREGAAQVVLSAGAILSLAVLRNGTDVAVADPTTGSVQLVRNAASAPVARVLASGLDGIGEIFPAWDGQSLFVALPGAGAVASIDLVSGEVESLSSSVTPVGLIPLRNHDTFLISAKPRQPGWVFYRDGAAGRVVFIPAAESAAREIPTKGRTR
ncbi:MAG: hypothetical protein LAQ69_16870 [Acidobacteriia bacterium]|nr:hypothetical protein [Terriglobia bacterium]